MPCHDTAVNTLRTRNNHMTRGWDETTATEVQARGVNIEQTARTDLDITSKTARDTGTPASDQAHGLPSLQP
jgi:hypothetical protein